MKLNSKTFLSAVLIFAVSIPVATAQKREKVSRYETKIYTSEKMGELLKREYRKPKTDSERGIAKDAALAALNAGKGIAGGYVSALVDVGVNALVGLMTQNSTNKQAWEDAVKAENTYIETLATLEPINNFYSEPSFDGPLDPAGMNFYGIGCVRTEGEDTTFYISTHIDESKISRIINHSKFELSLDTLIIDPCKLDLPNSNFPDAAFSFDERKNLQITVEMQIVSSWITYAPQLQTNQQLGSFTVNIPVSEKDLDADGKLRYIRKSGENARYKITGESFIIPRSFMGYRDDDGKYQDSWGTGDYDLQIKITESCGITENFRKQWKTDWKRRKAAKDDENFVRRSWQLVSSQKWDKITQQWVLTTIKAPADMLTDEILGELNLPAGTTGSGAKSSSAKPK
jgi:hypothetical protein